MKTITIAVALILLSACATLPGPKQEKVADYGPFPNNYEDIARNYLMAELKDPSTVQIKTISPPIKRWIGDKFTGIKYGYLVCAEVNSKNFFGDLTGFRQDALLIREDSVIDYVKDGEMITGVKLCD